MQLKVNDAGEKVLPHLAVLHLLHRQRAVAPSSLRAQYVHACALTLVIKQLAAPPKRRGSTHPEVVQSTPLRTAHAAEMILAAFRNRFRWRADTVSVDLFASFIRFGESLAGLVGWEFVATALSASGSGQICSQRSTKFSSNCNASRKIASSSIDATGQGRIVSKSMQWPDSSAIQ
uniref:Uncharacterized protein n=1 Tax=Anopheles coluzzii TaxID=1518534 RepID=A0A8W7PZS4_ANOCL